MLSVPVDRDKVARCRELASQVATEVQGYIDKHTSVGAERTILRAYGAEGIDDRGAPLVNVAVERYRDAGLLGDGISMHLGRALAGGAPSPQEAAERLAYAEVDRGESGPSIEQI